MEFVGSNGRRVAIVGAGPIGLEAALYAAALGYDVHVYEREAVAANVREWGHVRLFSPFGMNASQWGRAALAQNAAGRTLPSEEALLSGRQFVEEYLLPLSRLPLLAGRIHEQVRVESIGRCRFTKGDAIGRPERAGDPFQLLLSDKGGERVERADVVLDCSGTFGNRNWAGAGGMPAIGERQLLNQSDYLLPDICGSDRSRFAGKATLIIGAGYSAATAVVNLAKIAEEEPETRIVWITRTDRVQPITPIENDSLPERSFLTTAANGLALSDESPVDWLPGRLIKRIARKSSDPDAPLTVRLQSDDGRQSRSKNEELTVDRVIANVGYRPDRTLYEELQVHECYASSGPMKLAAALLGETSADCTAQTSHGPASLLNPEPNLFILGSKSYGRNSRFLLRIGLQQIVDAFNIIGQQIAKR